MDQWKEVFITKTVRPHFWTMIQNWEVVWGYNLWKVSIRKASHEEPQGSQELLKSLRDTSSKGLKSWPFSFYFHEGWIVKKIFDTWRIPSQSFFSREPNYTVTKI